MMKVLFAAILIIGGLVAIGDNLTGLFPEGVEAKAKPATATATAKPSSVKAKPAPVQVAKVEPSRWYEDGTLHTSPASAWNRATSRDKLATSADWVVTMRGADHYNHSVANALPDARALVVCLNESLAGVIPKDRLSYLASVCAVLMGW